MVNTFKVFHDYRSIRKTRNSTNTGMPDLGTWLDEEKNQEDIYNYRLFYVLKSNADDVVKFGIAGYQGGKSGAWGRLHQYINEYGYSTDLNPCSGIKLLYLAGTVYNPTVIPTESAVYMKEKACKDYFRATAIKGRGYERILKERLDELFKIIDNKSNKSWEDIEKDRRKTARLKQANITAEDAVLAILKHETAGGKSRERTKYLVQWSRAYVLLDETDVKADNLIETDTTWETAYRIITFLDGSRALDVYKALHPDAKFRDQ
jgi:hypothetical protein